jgi:acyl-CoA reductase-like NAD-dependent aldehyde dehydrogenase
MAPALKAQTQLFVDGRYRDAKGGKRFPTVNPATEEVITEIALAAPEDLDEAVNASRTALAGPWGAMAPQQRSELVWKMGELIKGKYLEELAELETADSGKTLFDSGKIEIPFAADLYQYYAGWTTKLAGDTLPVRGNAFAYTLREPVGVVGMITPWNFPFLLLSWKVAPALAMGCTMVVKPASQTPLTALKLGEIALEAGIPPGVINVIPGPGKTIGMGMVRHPGIDKIAFTGSTAVGQEVMREAAASCKRISLELGGKSPNIVFADADMKMAARGALSGIFYNKGEVCAAGSRLFVERKAHDELLNALVEGAKKTTIGDPREKTTRLGPVVSAEQQKNVLGYIRAGKDEGATLACGGEAAQVGGKGFFVQPTIFTGVKNQMRIAREEIFGPVLSVIACEDEADAIRQANESIYGLAAGIWTRDVKRAHRVARAIKAGTVWVNAYNLYDPALPFGGYKQSGFGRELGEAALDLYTERKSVWVDLN